MVSSFLRVKTCCIYLTLTPVFHRERRMLTPRKFMKSITLRLVCEFSKFPSSQVLIKQSKLISIIK